MSMELWLRVALTLAVAFAGGWLAGRLKLPAAAMLGGMFFVAALSITTGLAVLPANTRPVLQTLGGIMLGWSLDRAEVAKLRRMAGPVALLVVGMFAVTITLGLLLHRFGGLDLATALFSSCPGGVADIALIADELGAVAATVSVLQLFRLLGVYLIYPPILKRLHRRQGSEPPCGPQIDTQCNKPLHWGNVALTMAAGTAGGLALLLLGVPAGGLVGGVIGAGVWNGITGRGAFPPWLKPWVQAAVGALIGAQMTADSLHAVAGLAVPIVLITVTLLVFTMGLGLVMHKLFGMELTTALLATTPGGLQEISMMAADLGCNATQVVTLHTVRMLSVVCLFPTLLKVLLSLA